MYQRHTPKRTARTVAQIREEAAKKQREDREARKEEAEKKRRASVQPEGSLQTQDEASKEKPATQRRESIGMPGSGKKKRNSLPGGAAAGSDQARDGSPSAGASRTPSNPTGEGIDSNLRDFLLSIKEELKQSTTEAVEKFDRRIGETEKRIEDLAKKVDKNNEEIDRKITTSVRAEVAKMAGTVAAPASSRREEAFHKCRRTLKVWPIRGECLEDSVKVFLKNKLKMDDQRIASFGKLQVTASKGKAAADRAEVLVVFEDRDDRDAVKASGYNLAGQKDAGMSIHVPGHLLDSLYALNSVGYSIKSNNEGVKRSVKFDDATQDLYLDIMIANKWRRISPKEAKNVLKRVPTTGGADSRSISADDLAGLVQGEPVEGLTGVVVVEDKDQDIMEA